MSESHISKFDSAAAAAFEDQVLVIANRLGNTIGDREQQSKFVQANYEATDNTESYAAVETKWNQAALSVQDLVKRAKELMGQNSITAQTAQKSAAAAIASMHQ